MNVRPLPVPSPEVCYMQPTGRCATFPTPEPALVPGWLILLFVLVAVLTIAADLYERNT